VCTCVCEFNKIISVTVFEECSLKLLCWENCVGVTLKHREKCEFEMFLKYIS